MRVCAVIVGGGAGTRLGGGTPKALRRLGGRRLYEHSVAAFRRAGVEVVVVLPPGRGGVPGGSTKLTAGGATRHDSMRAGLAAVDPRCDIVLIHDAARPFVSTALIRRVVAAAAKTGAAVPALSPSETVKQVIGRRVRTLDRATIRLAQTPQGFRSDKLRAAIARLGARARGLTDDVQLFERLGWPVAVVEGDPRNVKLTVPHEWRLARKRFRSR